MLSVTRLPPDLSSQSASLHQLASLAGAAYRARQFFRALLARVDPDELSIADAYLPPQAQALFRGMRPNDQRHALDVVYALQGGGHTERALMQAALLHDVGKSEGVRLWHRVLIVLLERWRPGWLQRLARERRGHPDPSVRGWRYPFCVHRQHPARGAALAAAAGCDPLAVALIRHHQDPLPAEWQGTREGELLAALKAADGAN